MPSLPKASHPGGDYRGRFAPTPSGALHLGHARTALVAWQRARRADGAFILRIEDLDGPRTLPGAREAIVDDLRWLGIDWDEGPDIGGPNAPYLQSQRNSYYERDFQTLQQRGRIYPCTCSRKDLQNPAQAPHQLKDLGPRYPGTCRKGPKSPQATTFAWRFRMTGFPCDFVDGFYGAVRYKVDNWDFVLRRKDDIWSYQLAVATDDRTMGITEVVRGMDLLPSTPWQRAIHQELGGPIPKFFHLPLVCDASGRRLAKRDASQTLRTLRERGESPRAIRETLLHSYDALGDSRTQTTQEG